MFLFKPSIFYFLFAVYVKLIVVDETAPQDNILLNYFSFFSIFLVFGHNELYLILKGSVIPCNKNGGNDDEDTESEKVLVCRAFFWKEKGLVQEQF